MHKPGLTSIFCGTSTNVSSDGASQLQKNAMMNYHKNHRWIDENPHAIALVV